MVNFRSLLEGVVGAEMTAWSLFNAVMPDRLQNLMVSGLRRLLPIVPLVRAGALELVPATDAAMSDLVQEIARQEVAAAPAEEQDPKNPAFLDMTEYAMSTGLCTSLFYWPIAGSAGIWNRLNGAAGKFAAHFKSKDIAFQRAVAQFDVPSVARVPLSDLLRVRADNQSFADLRRGIGVALVDAQQAAEKDGAYFAAQLFRDRLETLRTRCEQSVRKTSVLDGSLLPTGAVLATAFFSFCLGVNPVSGPNGNVELISAAAAPSVAWLVTRLRQQFNKRSGLFEAASAIYGAMLDSTDGRSETEWD